jgi:hypothetical protein
MNLIKKIMLNEGWGNKNVVKNKSSGNLLFSKHQTKSQKLRELGKRFLNGIKIKYPRSRKVDVNI